MKLNRMLQSEFNGRARQELRSPNIGTDRITWRQASVAASGKSHYEKPFTIDLRGSISGM